MKYLPEHKAVYQKLLALGLCEKEAEHVINIISNSLRQCGADGGCENFRLSVDGGNDKQYEQQRKNGGYSSFDKTIFLNSGKVVKFGFHYGF